MNDELRIVLTGPPLKTNAATALVVGTALNAINQGDAIVAGDAVNWGKFALNFVVPLLVASWGSYGALLAQRRARESGRGLTGAGGKARLLPRRPLAERAFGMLSSSARPVRGAD